MIKIQAISTEATSAPHQGLIGQGKKGKGKQQSLFSKLLASLEHRSKTSQKIKKVTTQEHALLKNKKNTPFKTTEVKATNSGEVFPESKTSKTNKKNTTHPENNKEILIANHQEVALMKNKTGKAFEELAAQSPKLARAVSHDTKNETSSKPTLFQSEKQNGVKTIGAQGKTNNIGKIKATTTTLEKASLQENQSATTSTQLKTAKPSALATTMNRQAKANPKHTNLTFQHPIQAVQKERLNPTDSLSGHEVATAQAITQKQRNTQVQIQPSINHTKPKSSKLKASDAKSPQTPLSDITTKHTQAQKLTTHDMQHEKQQSLEDGLQAQAPTVTGLRRNAQQPNQTIANSTTLTSANLKTMDTNQASSQQDMASHQQDSNPIMLGMHKIEHKNKSMDFQAQMAYKTQQTYTPHDAMLEIVKSAKDGSTSLELQLEPAHLGKVQVNIQMDASKQLQVMFTLDQQTSKHALEQHMPQLRLSLAQQGLDLGGFSMQMNQQPSQQGEQQSSPQQNINQLTEAGFMDAQAWIPQTKIGVNIATDGRLSILA